MSQNISNLPPNMEIYNRKQHTQQQQPNFAAGSTPVSSGAVMQNNPLLSHAEKAQGSTNTVAAGAILSAGALLGLNNYINNPLQTKDYNDTFFRKIEVAVDNFANKHKSKPFIKNTNDFFKKLSTGVKNRVNNSEILRTLFKKPSIGGPNVQSQAAGARGHISSRALEVMRKYKADYKAATGRDYTAFDAILKKAEKESYKYYDDIIKAIRTSGADYKKVISKRPWWGMGLVKNKVSLQEILNKAHLIENYKAAGKTLGQRSSGYLMRATECLTNGMFSGKGQVLIQAFVIAQSISEAAKAEKGEKIPVFMASLAELMAFFATMGIQMRVVNHLAGLKYIGMSPDNVKKFQKAMEIANKASKAGNQKAYAKMVHYMDGLKAAAKANTKWYQKPIKWIGNLMSFGRIKETLVPLKASKSATMFSKIPYGLKVGLGYAGRFALVASVVMPFFSGVGKGISHAIFGKPVKTIARDKAKEEEEAKKAQQPQMQNPQNYNPSTVQQPAPVQAQTPQPSAKPGDLINRMNTIHNNPQNNPQNAMGAQSMSQTAPAASTIKSPDAGIKRTYIPNPVLGPENPTNTAASRSARIDAVLRQADLAEAMAQKYM